MRSVKTLVLAFVPTCVVLAGAQHAVAAKFKVLYDFCAKANCADGSGPRGELYLNNSGELYGVTTGGGDNGRGIVFRLVPGSGDGKWKYQRLYSFCAKPDCRDGSGAASRLIPDLQGNLYGLSYNPSLVFVLKPNAEGTRWKAQTPYRLCDGSTCKQGFGLTGGLTYQGAQNGTPYDGNSPLYGTAIFGGRSGEGTVFSIAPQTGGKWKYSKLHDFCTETEDCGLQDGALPTNGLLPDANGDLFGATEGGGENFSGTIFRLSPKPAGKWKETILYTFCTAGCDDGQSPAGIARDALGNFYGATSALGANGKGGTLFELAANGSFSVLHAFCSAPDCGDGHQPGSPPIADAAGNLFGTTIIGGGNDIDEGHLGGGVVYERAADGSFKVLHAFCAEAGCADGQAPFAGLTLDAGGRLFGVTNGGGKFGGGVIFESDPSSL